MKFMGGEGGGAGEGLKGEGKSDLNNVDATAQTHVEGGQRENLVMS